MVQIGTMAAFLFSPNRESWCPGETGRRGLPRGSEFSFEALLFSGALKSKRFLAKLCLAVCVLATWILWAAHSRQTEKSYLCNPACFPFGFPFSPLTFMHLTL